MQDCRIDKFLAHSVPYNADGDAAPDLPVFEDIEIRNCTITGSEKVVELEGFLKQSFEDRQNYVKNVLMENVVIDDESGEIHLKRFGMYTGKMGQSRTASLSIIQFRISHSFKMSGHWRYREAKYRIRDYALRKDMQRLKNESESKRRTWN